MLTDFQETKNHKIISMNFLIGYCPDCKGIRVTTPYNKKLSAALIETLKGDLGDIFTTSKVKFNQLVKNHNLIIRQISKDFLDIWNCSTCGCTEICKKVRTFKDACSILKIPDVVPDYSILPSSMQIRLVAMYKLIIITKVLNEGWEPEYEGRNNYVTFYPLGFYNSDQEFPFKHEFGMHEAWEGSDIDYQGAGLLMFKDHGLGHYAGVQFRDLYLDLYQYPESYLNRYQ
ncbi:hypothetical protein ASG31_17685 [Chryseobacterium sp. Leaf404]|nr:hypothetical protein ASG31_17685 [Chryseobacterium sp. Leaf404]